MENIIQHLKNLIIDDLFDESFDILVTCFFDNLLIDNLTKLERFQVIISILLSVMGRLKEAEDYENMQALQEVYTILYSKIHKLYCKKKNRVELIINDQYYQSTLHKILSK